MSFNTCRLRAADMVIACGRYCHCLWPMWSWPIWFVADIVVPLLYIEAKPGDVAPPRVNSSHGEVVTCDELSFVFRFKHLTSSLPTTTVPSLVVGSCFKWKPLNLYHGDLITRHNHLTLMLTLTVTMREGIKSTNTKMRTLT